MDLAWTLNGNAFYGTVTMFGEMPLVGTLTDGVLEVVYGDGFYLKFEKGEIPIAKFCLVPTAVKKRCRNTYFIGYKKRSDQFGSFARIQMPVLRRCYRV